jgi:hypothetical protein
MAELHRRLAESDQCITNTFQPVLASQACSCQSQTVLWWKWLICGFKGPVSGRQRRGTGRGWS